MTENDELTARKMRQLLEERWPDTNVTINTVNRERKHLGCGGNSPKLKIVLRRRQIQQGGEATGNL